MAEKAPEISPKRMVLRKFHVFLLTFLRKFLIGVFLTSFKRVPLSSMEVEYLPRDFCCISSAALELIKLSWFREQTFTPHDAIIRSWMRCSQIHQPGAKMLGEFCGSQALRFFVVLVGGIWWDVFFVFWNLGAFLLG